MKKNNLTLALNALYTSEEKIYPAYDSKYNAEGWHYLAVENLSILLRGVASKHDGDLSCMDCFHFFCKRK